jgi:hypothetical protein
MDMEADISSLGALMSEPARGRILLALLGRRALPATELAQRADQHRKDPEPESQAD